MRVGWRWWLLAGWLALPVWTGCGSNPAPAGVALTGQLLAPDGHLRAALTGVASGSVRLVRLDSLGGVAAVLAGPVTTDRTGHFSLAVPPGVTVPAPGLALLAGPTGGPQLRTLVTRTSALDVRPATEAAVQALLAALALKGAQLANAPLLDADKFVAAVVNAARAADAEGGQSAAAAVDYVKTKLIAPSPALQGQLATTTQHALDATGDLPVQVGRMRVAVRWPAAGGARLIPDASHSLRVSAVNPVSQQVVGTTLIVRPSTEGTLACSAIGSLTLTAQALPLADGSGTPQASGSQTVTVVAGDNPPVALTLASTIARLAITPNPATVTVGSTLRLSLAAYDANNALVLLPDTVNWHPGSAFPWFAVAGDPAPNTVQATVTPYRAGTGDVVAEVRESASSGFRSASVMVTVQAAGRLGLDSLLRPAWSQAAGDWQ